MGKIKGKIDIDDYLYDVDEDEYIDIISKSYYMRYVNFVISLTIVLIIVNCILSYIILSNKDLQNDDYAYTIALLSFLPPLWFVIVVFILFIFFDFSYLSVLLGIAMIGLALISVAIIILGGLYLSKGTEDVNSGLIASLMITNSIILLILIISPIYRAYRGSVTKYNYQTYIDTAKRSSEL